MEKNSTLLSETIILGQKLLIENKIEEGFNILNEALELCKTDENTEAEVGLKIIIDTLKSNFINQENSVKSEDLPKEKIPLSLTLYNYFMALAELNIKQNVTREALYYLEESVYTARKLGAVEQETYAFTKLGELLNSSGKYSDARAFFDYVFYNRSRKYDFSCQSANACCTKLKVQVSPDDIRRVINHLPELKAEDFIDPVNLENTKADEPFYLKKRGNSECVFLKDKLCGIHEFKPLLCKNWPMLIEEDDHVIFTINEMLKSDCHYQSLKQNKDENKIKKSLRESNYYNSEQIIITEKVQALNNFNLKDNFELLKLINDYQLTEKEIFEEVISTLKSDINTLKISSSFVPARDEKLKSFLVFYNNDPNELLNRLSVAFEDKFKLQRNKSTLHFTKDNFKFRVYILGADSLKQISLYDELILYEKENYPFPEIIQPVLIPLEDEAYEQLIKTIGKIIFSTIKKNKLDEAKEAFQKLKYLESITDKQILINKITIFSNFLLNKYPVLRTKPNSLKKYYHL
jgi:Fe-S-cluster containining protein